jgi:hypothetical protein
MQNYQEQGKVHIKPITKQKRFGMPGGKGKIILLINHQAMLQ